MEVCVASNICKRMNILYIDDDAEDREIFRDAVLSIDQKIVLNTANDGLDGIKVLEELTVVPDFIFLDINMPRMNGKQFLIEIRQTIRLRTIPVIIYSTTTQPGEIELCKKLGAKDFLVKPDKFERLRSYLTEILCEETYKSNSE